MFDVVAKHKRMVQFVLALITLPFAFFGVDYYFRRGDAVGEVASFDGGRVTQADFANALRDQQEMLRRSQRAVDPALFDNPEVRYSILQNVIRDRLIEKKGADLHFAVSNEQVFERIAADPRFQDDGKFSLDRFKLLLAQAGIPEAAYENSIRQQLLSEKLVEPIAAGGIVAKAAGEGFVTLLEQQREVAVATVDAAPFVKDVKVDDAAVRAFYDANTNAFRTPEEVKFEYVVLTPDALAAQAAVTPDELKAQYAASVKQYTRDEERQAAHILVVDQTRRVGRRQGRREEEGGRHRGAGEGESGEVRRARKAVFGGPGLGRAGRRSRQQSARHDGQGLRRRRVRDEAR